MQCIFKTQEEKHEWGFDSANSSLSKLAIAARRWRKKVQEENRNRKLQVQHTRI